MTGLEIKEVPSETYEVRYGEKGKTFYVILDGEVSVWVPINKTYSNQFVSQWLRNLYNENIDFDFDLMDKKERKVTLKWYLE
jgi:hypothetical protein